MTEVLEAALQAYHRGEPRVASHLLKEALEKWRHRPDGWVLFGAALKAEGNYPGAEQAYKEAIRLLPNFADAWQNLGNLYAASGLHGEAADAYQQALTATVGSIDASNAAILLAGSAFAAGRLEAAFAALDRALKQAPNNGSAFNQRGKLLWEIGDTESAVTAFRDATRAEPDNPLFAVNLLLVSQFSETADEASLAHLARQAAGLIAGQVDPALCVDYAPPSGPGQERIRVAYLSSDFRHSAPGHFIHGILAGHDRSRFNVFALSTIPGGDGWTEVLKRHIDHWEEVSSLNDAALTRRIRQLGIHILVDLNGYTGGHRLGALAARAAPVQVSWLGYEGSTQLPEMDVLMGDWQVTPPANSACHSERVVRLPFDFACYRAPDYAPGVATTPALSRGYVTFGSFNKLAKLGPATLRLWARVLRRVPGSRLLLKWRHAPSALASERILGILMQEGIARERIEFRDASPYPEMLGEYANIDIALDPFPFSGGATTCDALWMGAPVVCLLGKRFASNHTASHLRAAGLPELVAESEDQYEDICATLAADPAALDRLRQTLRPQMALSPLCNDRLFMTTVERHFRELLEGVNWAP